MKKILITGKNSYVGTSLKKWLANYPAQYYVNSISLRDNSWKEKDFSEYDVVFHVAGVAHIKERKHNEPLYYEVNCDLSYKVAQKAKKENVKHFIFLSSMSVYGIERGVIGEDSPIHPKTIYGKSKLLGEKLVTSLESKYFKVTVLRPPMIYGKGCKGNYNKLVKLALITPVFPDIDNKRSMIYIDNLSEFVKSVIDNRADGIMFPQNKEYVNTKRMVESIAKVHGKKIFITKFFNPLIYIMKRNKVVSKVFGDLIYETTISNNKIEYISFEDSIGLTED